MTITEAIKSGKPFKRKGQTRFSTITPAMLEPCYSFSKESILADDWEIEEKKVEITRASLFRAWRGAFTGKLNIFGMSYPTCEDLAKELGL